jgi:hypothetical protein
MAERRQARPGLAPFRAVAQTDNKNVQKHKKQNPGALRSTGGTPEKPSSARTIAMATRIAAHLDMTPPGGFSTT